MQMISKQLMEQLTELTPDEQLQVLRFAEFLKHHRELLEDASLAKHIEAGLTDDFLTVSEAKAYLVTAEDVADSDQ